MEIKILGISASPIKDGNTDHFLKEALNAAKEKQGVVTEMVSLAKRDIRDCKHCNWCLTKQKTGRYCAIEDDVYEIYPKIEEADGLLLATPVYLGRLSGYLASFLDRLRVFMEGNFFRGRLKDKVGGSLAVAWSRHGGIETALLSINYAFLILEMVIVSATSYGALYGSGGLSSFQGSGKIDAQDKLMVLKDDLGLKGARALAGRMVEMAMIIKAGKEVLKK